MRYTKPMKITKFEHACFVVEHEGRSLVVDPGTLTSNLTRRQDVDAIVITHEHSDHIDMRIITAIMDENPTAEIYTTTSTAPELSLYTVHIAKPGQRVTPGVFDLRFFGGTHAAIHSSVPEIDNIGVLINDAVYYPGDSFVVPDRPVKALFLPISAPWLKLSEALDFALAMQSPLVIPTHDSLLSALGTEIYETHLRRVIASYGGSYVRPDGPLDIA